MSTTFSYAQAAKGPSGSPVPAKSTPTDVQSTESKPEESSNDVTPESVTTTSETETPKEAEKATPIVNKDEEFTTVTSKTRSKAAHSRTSSPSVRSTKEPKENDSSNTNGKADASSEKKSQSDGKTEKSENASEGSKDKSEKTEKADKAEKNEKPAPPKELKAAPLPSVNIWQQRKEAQDAKVKTAPVAKSVSGKAEETQQESSKSKKKGTDGTTDGTKSGKKSDGAKGRDDSLPAVADASSWPTPEVALGEEKKKAQEKTDKTEKTDKSPIMRSHGKEKWMPVDYVPTAVFNTPLPPSGRGGSRRNARGGREGGRGAAHPTGEKAGSGQAAQGSAGKQTATERVQNEAGPNRAASLPAQSRRSASADVNAPEGRKAQPAERGRGGRAAEDGHANGKHTNGENVARSQKQFGKNGQANSKNPNLAVDAQAAARTNDRRTESGSKSADPSSFEFNRGGRANRGGRGPYNSFNGQNSQFGNVANNNGFVPKSFGGFNDRQRSHNGLANGNQQGNRMPMRSPSLPASGNMYNVYPFPADINTMYGYQAVNPAPMSAMPYQQYMEPFSLMSMLSMQLEYYFSVDNMCKDMFLRRHMDSQGFVPLGVIASFKRVKSLTEDFELIRHISRQLRTVEYQTGEDGVDRLRPRERWGQWILPYDQRDPSAQHEGAAPAMHTGKNDENAPFNGHGPNGSLPNGAQQFVPNGTSPRGSQTLSSTAPEFQPSTAQNEIVGYPSDFDCYPRKSSPRECSPHMNPSTDPEVNNHPVACGVDSNPTSPPLFHSGLAVPASGSKCADNTKNRPLPAPGKPRNPQWKGKGKPFHQKSVNVSNYSEQFSSNHASGGHSIKDPSKLGLVIAPPYHTWSRYLTSTFDLPLYNEFRRLALDDFFTRHVDYGFKALLWYYKACLDGSSPMPQEVISDLVGLSRCPAFEHYPAVFGILRSAMSSKNMEKANRANLGLFFNRDRQMNADWRYHAC